MDRQHAFELAINAAIDARIFHKDEKDAIIKSLNESVLSEVAELSKLPVAICWTRSAANAGCQVSGISFSHYSKIYTKITKSR
jgi:hypothetical protein